MDSRYPVMDRAHSACVRRRSWCAATLGLGRSSEVASSRERSSARARGRASIGALALAVALVVGAPAARAGDSTAKEGGLGMAAALSTLVYGPLKVVYAVGGTTASGFAWIFSGGDSRVAQTVLTRSVRGTYVITPETLQGQREIEFVGRAPEYREATPQVASAPEAW